VKIEKMKKQEQQAYLAQRAGVSSPCCEKRFSKILIIEVLLFATLV
jgi:hypothetical protein